MPGSARIVASPHGQEGGYTPGLGVYRALAGNTLCRSEKLGRVSRNSPRGSREKSGEVELLVVRYY